MEVGGRGLVGGVLSAGGAVRIWAAFRFFLEGIGDNRA